MPSSNRLIILSAPSGAGKTTLCQRLLKDLESVLTLSISSTTRAPRGKERSGVEYHFLSHAEFEAQIQADGFAEWAKVHGNYYGTSKAAIQATFDRGKSVLLDIDVQGAAQLRQTFPQLCVTIFIAPPSLEILRQRLTSRQTDTPEVIERRMKEAETELSQKHLFDRIIINDDLETAYAELKQYIQSALLSPLHSA